MKKTLLFAIPLLFCSQVLFAQSRHKIDASQVPQATLNSFQAKYPGVKVDFWEMEGNDFEVMFESQGKTMEAVFDINGKWIETEIFLKEEELPPAVDKALNRDLKKWNIVRIEMVSTPTESGFYEIDLKKGDDMSEVFYDQNGTKISDDRWEDEDEDDMLAEEDEDMDGNQD